MCPRSRVESGAMAAKLIPATVDSETSKACKNGEWEEIVFNDVPVSVGVPQTSIDYELNFAKAGLGMALWVEYTPGAPGNTLTIGALWSTRGGTLFFPAVDGPSVDITSNAFGGSVVKICCPGTPDFRITLTSDATDVAPDHVTAILCGTCGCCGGGGC